MKNKNRQSQKFQLPNIGSKIGQRIKFNQITQESDKQNISERQTKKIVLPCAKQSFLPSIISKSGQKISQNAFCVNKNKKNNFEKTQSVTTFINISHNNSISQIKQKIKIITDQNYKIQKEISKVTQIKSLNYGQGDIRRVKNIQKLTKSMFNYIDHPIGFQSCIIRNNNADIQKITKKKKKEKNIDKNQQFQISKSIKKHQKNKSLVLFRQTPQNNSIDKNKYQNIYQRIHQKTEQQILQIKQKLKQNNHINLIKEYLQKNKKRIPGLIQTMLQEQEKDEMIKKQQIEKFLKARSKK